MVDWLELFRKISEQIRQEVKPIFGFKSASKAVGRGAGGDVSKYVDFLAEDIVVKALKGNNVSCTLISEECGERKIGGGGQSHVILDSIDGTTNAIRSIPFVSTSMAHSTTDQLIDVNVALVKDLYNNIEFTAIKGRGAFQGGRPLRSSTTKSLGEAIVAMNINPKDKLAELIERTSAVLNRVLKIRCLGSTALELCYVGSGALDAFIDLEGLTRATDLAAAYLILRESGGIIVTPLGETLRMPLKASARAWFISTANENICNEILSYLRSQAG